MLTDGIVEVANPSDEEFGLDRVERLLIENSARPLTEFADTLIGATGAWTFKRF
jgi:serine phosphatase RsbU (regulator of sigma subunit)